MKLSILCRLTPNRISKLIRNSRLNLGYTHSRSKPHENKPNSPNGYVEESNILRTKIKYLTIKRPHNQKLDWRSNAETGI